MARSEKNINCGNFNDSNISSTPRLTSLHTSRQMPSFISKFWILQIKRQGMTRYGVVYTGTYWYIPSIPSVFCHTMGPPLCSGTYPVYHDIPSPEFADVVLKSVSSRCGLQKVNLKSPSSVKFERILLTFRRLFADFSPTVDDFFFLLSVTTRTFMIMINFC